MGHVSKSEVVEANPRLIMAVVAIGMIVGALLAPGKTEGTSQPAPASVAAQAR